MSKTKRQIPYNFGRVFFPGKSQAIPDRILFQPLGNHVGNVKALAKKWQVDNISNNFSLDRVLKGIDLHDICKPQRFQIQSEINKLNRFKKYIYSFKGHPYGVEYPQDVWAEALARGHHYYSVEEINKAIYQLKKIPQYAEILARDPLTYARELYILEMCDQIEAELACRIFEDDDQAESRTFMDFTISQLEETVYQVDPYPFEKGSFNLTFKSWLYKPSAQDQQALQKLLDNGQDNKLGKQLDELVKSWWDSQEGQLKAEDPIEITIQPYLSSKTSQPLNDHTNCTLWYQRLTDFSPNPMQVDVFKNVFENDETAFILKAPTGVGKFEAIVIPFLAKLSQNTLIDPSRLILPLPSRSLLEDQKQRCENYLKRFSKIFPGREVSLVVDTGSQMQRFVYYDGEEKTPSRTVNTRRHLYKGDIILTTIDKFMYRYFGYGDNRKSFIFPYRINQGNALICFDEAHSYDNISFTNFCSLVKALYEAGRSLILMTATLPQKQLERFEYLQDDLIDYIDNENNLKKLNSFSKQKFANQKQFEWSHNIEYNSQSPEIFCESFIQIVLKELQDNPQHRIIATVETVKDAVTIYKQIKSLLGTNQDDQGQYLFLYHGRMPDIPKSSEFSRTNIYQRLKERDENNLPYLLVTTSAIEVGCDLNSTLLITQLCNPENLIQRAGRCNRKGNIQGAKIIVVGDNIPEFTSSLSEEDLVEYRKILEALNHKNFNARMIMNCVSNKQQVDDYRIVELFSILHDYVYNADLTCQSSHEKGLVITRSWTPSVTLVYDDGKNDNKINENPQITIPIDRLIIKKDKKTGITNEYYNVNVDEYLYNQEETRWKLEPIKYWGQAYKKDIVVTIYQEHDGAIFGTHQPYEYNPELGFVELPGVFIKWKSTDYEERLQYKYSESKSVVITYIKALTEG